MWFDMSGDSSGFKTPHIIFVLSVLPVKYVGGVYDPIMLINQSYVSKTSNLD